MQLIIFTARQNMKQKGQKIHKSLMLRNVYNSLRLRHKQSITQGFKIVFAKFLYNSQTCLPLA